MGRFSNLTHTLRDSLGPGRLGRHLSQNMLQIGIETGCRTVTTFIVAALFQAALFGRLGVLLTLVHFLYTVADGANASLVKFTAESRAQDSRLGAGVGWRSAWVLAALAMIAGGVVFGGAALFSIWRGEGGMDALAPVLLLAWAYGSLWILKIGIEAAFRGLKDFAPPALWALVISPLHAIVLIAAVWSGWRLTGYFAIMAAGTLVHALALIAHFHMRHRRPLGAPGNATSAALLAAEVRARVISQTRAMLRYGAPLMLRGVVWFFFLKVNILIVALYSSDVETGYVTLADRFLLLPLLVTGAYVGAVAPRMAELGALGERERMQQYMSKSNTALLFLMLAFGAVFVAMGPVLARFMPDYEPVGLMLLALAPFLVIKAWGGLAMSGALIPGGQARLALAIGIGGSAANLAFNMWLVPQAGAYGSIIGMIAAHTLVTLAAVVFARRRMGLVFRLGKL